MSGRVLLKALYECEWATYEAALDAAKRLGEGRARQALRAVVAHANEALGELIELASRRTIRLAAPVAVARELVHRFWMAALGGRAAGRQIDPDAALDRLEEQVVQGMFHARLLRSVAMENGDAELAGYLDRWHRARWRLAATATVEIQKSRSER